MGASSASLVLIQSSHRPHVLWHLYMKTLESVVDPRLFDPRVGDDKTYITTMGMQQTMSMVELPNAAGQTGKTAPGDLLHLRQGYYLTTVEWKEFPPGSSLSHLDYGSRDHDLSLVSGICIVAINLSMVLLPCAASSTWTWVNQLLTLVQPLG